MPFDEEEPRSAGEAAAPASGWEIAGNAGSGWGADTDAPADSPRGDKFRRDRDSPERRDRFGRDRRSRSRSPADARMPRRRSRSPVRRQPAADDSDRYIPQYDREGGGSGDRDRYQSGGGSGGGRYGNRGYNGSRGARPPNRGGEGGGMYAGGGGDMMGGRAGGIPDPRTFEQVVPFKYFAEWLKSQESGRRLDQDEVRERYEDYRREALQRLYTQFFSEHKEDDWRCAKLHLRRGLQAGRAPLPSGNWVRNLDNRNDVIIHPLEAERLFKEGGKSVDLEIDKELDSHIKRLDEGRYRCAKCAKLFKGDAFVRKHIRNKHPEVVPETLVRDISFFNNFVREAPHFVQLGTGGALPVVGGMGGGGMMGGGGGMRDRNAGFMPQMMMPGMMAAPYMMMPGMMPAGMVPGMMQMGVPGYGMMGMMGGDRGGQGGMYNQQFRGGQGNNSGNGRGAGVGRSDMRPVRSYVDLDAPAEGEADFGF
ncbi:hypothetical protein GGI04_002010 [Coemansia thaxteri]|nr:hypothetical protein GGI04_002010 [Coemansia thaxteri]